MGDVEKAQYYADNPTMAKVTQLLQLGFSMTDIAKLQNQLYPEFVAEQQQIAQGDVFAGMGPGDISQLGVNLGQFGDADTINSIANGTDGIFNGRNNPTGGGGVPAAGGYNTGVGSYGGSLWGGGSGGSHSLGG